MLGMPYIKTVDILTINCNTTESKEAGGLEKCKTNMKQEIDATEKHQTNTDGSKFQIGDKPVVNYN